MVDAVGDAVAGLLDERDKAGADQRDPHRPRHLAMVTMDRAFTTVMAGIPGMSVADALVLAAPRHGSL